MSIAEIFLIAVSLSMDAFAVSVTLGLAAGKPGIRETLVPGIYFGFFQALMPLIGFLCGTFFAARIHNVDHWVAFILLGIIGAKMIKDSFSKEEKTVDENPYKFLKMIVLAIATSIDALAVGITFAFLKINIFTAILIIGLTTFCISSCGAAIGNKFGERFRSKAEFAGGVILVILGFRFLLEHLFFG